MKKHTAHSRQRTAETTSRFDPTDIFAALNTAKVRYLVFGGLAVVLYGVGRVTWDVDLIVHLTASNVEQLAKALKRIGFVPRVPADPSGLADANVRKKWIEQKHMKVYSFIDNRTPPRNVDVMIQPPPNFDALYRKRQVVNVREVAIPLVPVRTLVKLKQAAGRPQDLQDVDDLRLLGWL